MVRTTMCLCVDVIRFCLGKCAYREISNKMLRPLEHVTVYEFIRREFGVLGKELFSVDSLKIHEMLSNSIYGARSSLSTISHNLMHCCARGPVNKETVTQFLFHVLRPSVCVCFSKNMPSHGCKE